MFKKIKTFFIKKNDLLFKLFKLFIFLYYHHL